VRTYELMAVLAPDIAEDEMPAAMERISAYITTGGGVVAELTTTSPWGRRRLAYPIRDYRDGFYALYRFDLDPTGINELERDLGLNNQVIRSLVTSYVPPKPKKPKKGTEGEGVTEGEGETVSASAGEGETNGAVMTAPSRAAMDTDEGATMAPDGTDLTVPPTAETPAAEPEPEDESEPARA
jgi:small subunit ribosomal protein S6